MLKLRNIGKFKSSPIGYGCMSLSHGYGPTIPHDEAIDLIRKVHDHGCNFFDTAEAYGKGENERILGEAIKPFRKDVIIGTKVHLPSTEARTYNELHDNLRRHIEQSLERLQTDYIDLYYQHRVYKAYPMEWFAEAMGDFIKEGLVRGWGQSQVTADQIRRAHAITPLSVVQSEYSLMERMYEKEVLPTCEELGIGFVPFSPLASGFLSGKYKLPDQYVGDDVRRVITRYYPENIKKNLPLLECISKWAKKKKCTLAQISLVWMLQKKPFIVPIPGTDKIEPTLENFGAADVHFTDEEYKQFEAAIAKIKIHGNRTDEDIGKLGSVPTNTNA